MPGELTRIPSRPCGWRATDTWRLLPTPRRLAALAALALPLLPGCMFTGGWLQEKPEELRRIDDAYLRHDELGIAYTTAGNVEHHHIVWFALPDLWAGAENAPVKPLRIERARGTLPEGAERIAVSRGPMVLPPRAVVAVFARPSWPGEYAVIVVSKDGQPWARNPWLRRDQNAYVPWWRYPALPFAVALDVATFPGQAVVGLVMVGALMLHGGGWINGL